MSVRVGKRFGDVHVSGPWWLAILVWPLLLCLQLMWWVCVASWHVCVILWDLAILGIQAMIREFDKRR